ncbi:MAG: Glu/Leu/Phe/Val dehydrogenase [Candidatus Tectomicrobia bacterium]|nr:Glu/Leu/Phe/Val dehydrogenase [Candidatus Tectomicrobia bacterium]
MAWMMDTYSILRGYTVHGVVTSKPILLGGSLMRREATGRGAVYVFERACRAWKWDPSRMRAAVQGFGNVGSVAAEALAALGVKVVAVADRTGAVRNERGLDIPALIAHARENRGEVRGFPGGEPLPPEELLTQPCEVLVPAALGNVITGENAGRLACRAVLECANGPTSPEADAILAGRGVTVLPDVLVNAGGVTVSYFEWVQDTEHYFWEAGEVDARLRKIMGQAFDSVRALAEEKRVSPRLASLMLGVSRVAEGKRLRGLYP